MTTTAKAPLPKLEDDVFSVIDSLKNSDAANRKKHMVQLMGYADKVDGAVSEAYSHFAYEYVKNNTIEFYDALTPADSTLLKKWANAAAGEVKIIEEDAAERERLLQEVEASHLAKRKQLIPEQAILDDVYLKALQQAVVL